MFIGLDHETKALIGATIDRFVREYGDVHKRRERLSVPDADERRFWPVMEELGILALPVPEAVGGIGGGARDVADAARILGAGLVVEPFIEGAVLPTALLAGTGRDVGDASGDAAAMGLSAVLVGGIPTGGRLVASPSRQGHVLSGRVSVVPAVRGADNWLLVARSPDGETLVFSVAAEDFPEIATHHRLMDCRSAADMDFSDVVLAANALVMRGGEADQAWERVRLSAVNAYAADAVGVMERLVRETCGYLVTRKQFGVTLATFQALQHRLVDMHMAFLEAQAISGHLSSVLDGEHAESPSWLAAAAVLLIEKAAARVGHEAIQMHGGMGVTEELVVSHLNARLVVVTRLMRGWWPIGSEMGGAGNE